MKKYQITQNGELIFDKDIKVIEKNLIADEDRKKINYCVIPNGVEEIERCAFFKCANLSEIEIPETVRKIGEGAFGYCGSLEKVNIPNGIKTIECGTFFLCYSLKEVEIPSSVWDIEYLAFAYCEKLERLHFSKNLSHIGKKAFSFCVGLNSVIIPNTQVMIEEGAFRHCKNLMNNYLNVNSLSSFNKLNENEIQLTGKFQELEM